MNRDRRGRFTCGNTIAQQGWIGLVAGPFQGDRSAARAYVAQLGRYAYAQQALAGTCLAHKLTLWPHPGTCDQFLSQWRETLNAITLDAVQEVQP